MAEYVVSKFFTIIVFLAMMIFFFFWISNQVSDLGLFFGFRTSHTVANDVANFITSVQAVPGETTITYSVSPDKSATQTFDYIVEIKSKIVCVTSFYGGDQSRETTDCATHPLNFNQPYICKSLNGNLAITIGKTISKSAGGYDSNIDVEENGNCHKEAAA